MHEILGLIDLLYEAVIESDKWLLFLEKAALFFDAHGAQIGHFDLVNHRLSFYLVFGYDWSSEHVHRYESLMHEDPRVRFFNSNPFKAVHCRMAVTDAELHASRVYKEVLSVGGIEYTLGVNLSDSDQTLSYFIVNRDATQPQFSDEECKKLTVLIPHLARALRLERALDTLDFGRQVAFSALDSMALGVAVIDETGRVCYSNKLARDIYDQRDGISFSDGYLCFSGRENLDTFRRFGQAIKTMPMGAKDAGQIFRIKRRSGAEAYSVIVSSIASHRSRISWKAPADKFTVVFLRDPDRAPETHSELLQRLYGLTNSEARLAHLIASGKTPKQGAKDMGITEGSARQYLKHIFRKTGVQSQPDLVRKVMTLPPVIDRADGKKSDGYSR